MSLASAKGPSVTVFLLPFTTLPAFSRGWPGCVTWPFSLSCLNQAIHFCMVCWICSGDVPRSPPRYRYKKSLMIVSSFGFGTSDLQRLRDRAADIYFARWGPPYADAPASGRNVIASPVSSKLLRLLKTAGQPLFMPWNVFG